MTHSTIVNVELKMKREKYGILSFTEEDFGDIDLDYDDPTVIATLFHDFLKKRIQIDQENSACILHSHAAHTLNIYQLACTSFIMMFD